MGLLAFVLSGVMRVIISTLDLVTDGVHLHIQFFQSSVFFTPWEAEYKFQSK
jgi:hypothetical protein